jgi:hypothetical protein
MVIKVNQKHSKKAVRSQRGETKSMKSKRALQACQVAAICAEIDSKRSSKGYIHLCEMLRG